MWGAVAAPWWCHWVVGSGLVQGPVPVGASAAERWLVSMGLTGVVRGVGQFVVPRLEMSGGIARRWLEWSSVFPLERGPRSLDLLPGGRVVVVGDVGAEGVVAELCAPPIGMLPFLQCYPTGS